jgi:hypothetical protein
MEIAFTEETFLTELATEYETRNCKRSALEDSGNLVVDSCNEEIVEHSWVTAS